MNLEKFRGKKIALIGFGIENISLAKLFLKHGIDFTILDRADDKFGNSVGQKLIDEYHLKFIAGENYLSDLSKYDFAFRSPGVRFLTPEIQAAKSSGTEITSSTKLFFDICPCPIIGVTGTKGKGTTASLISKILKKKSKIKNQKSKLWKVYLVGNIGVAPFDVAEEITKDDIVVFELSSFQLQDAEISPHIAVVVNLSDDHLDYHQSLEEYRLAKYSILKYQNAGDFAVLNFDYPESRKLENIGKGKKFFFSAENKIENGAYVNQSGEVISTFSGEEKICDLSEINLIGRHNLENIAAATIVAKILNVETEIIRQAVLDFKGLPHRLEFVREINGVEYYNDSFSTNPTPTIAAVKSFSVPITLILGGSSKGADFSQLAEEIKKSPVKNIITIGAEGPKIAEAIKSTKNDAKITTGADNINKIVKQAEEVSPLGSVILFSPACASFDMFKNYKERGEKFKNSVNQNANIKNQNDKE
ncbi:MAG: UDP-N-acetylmuramoyl-L-alanine--D-glutamate ligase [Candidatus Berkelbacteria bacterium]|nr:UDP-N-acetylmuramoyl-L-alanine--D-glutamate ligase [Candidatus Berkelbacteria bacterium]